MGPAWLWKARGGSMDNTVKIWYMQEQTINCYGCLSLFPPIANNTAVSSRWAGKTPGWSHPGCEGAVFPDEAMFGKNMSVPPPPHPWKCNKISRYASDMYAGKSNSKHGFTWLRKHSPLCILAAALVLSRSDSSSEVWNWSTSWIKWILLQREMPIAGILAKLQYVSFSIRRWDWHKS